MRQRANDGLGEQQADQRDRQRQAQRDQQPAVQRCGQFGAATFAPPAGHQRLYTGAQTHHQGDGDEVGVAADADPGEGFLPQVADHGCIHQVEQALAEHAADDRQAQAENVLEPLAL